MYIHSPLDNLCSNILRSGEARRRAQLPTVRSLGMRYRSDEPVVISQVQLFSGTGLVPPRGRGGSTVKRQCSGLNSCFRLSQKKLVACRINWKCYYGSKVAAINYSQMRTWSFRVPDELLCLMREQRVDAGESKGVWNTLHPPTLWLLPARSQMFGVAGCGWEFGRGARLC